MMVCFIGITLICDAEKPLKSPLGTIYLDTNLYIDQQPVRVLDYMEFLFDIKMGYSPNNLDSINKLPLYGISEVEALSNLRMSNFDSIFYERMLIRTWQVVSSDRKVLGIDNQLMGNKYIRFPIVNVNYYQMVEYCRWRTAKVKLYYAMKSKSMKEREKYPLDFEFRVIKKSEWELAMSKYFENVVKLESKNDDMLGVNDPKPYPDGSQKQFSYISENAAEYLAEDIVTTGLNWNSKYGIGDIRYVYYDNPTDWISFRCVCYIKEAKIQPVENKNIKKESKPEKEKSAPIKKEKAKKLKGIDAEDVKRRK